MIVTAGKTLKRALLGMFVAPIVAFGAGASAISDPTPVLLDVDSYYLWHTATGGTMRVEWTFPLNATVANLAVTGRTVKVSCAGVTAEYVDIDLPTPSSAKEEQVLDFTLSFNDGTVKKTSLGLVRGRTDCGGITTGTACLASTNSVSWPIAPRRFVIPVPEGAETVMVAGETVETGLGGAAGWLALGPYASGTILSVSADDASCDLVVQGDGLTLIFK